MEILYDIERDAIVYRHKYPNGDVYHIAHRTIELVLYGRDHIEGWVLAAFCRAEEEYREQLDTSKR